MHMSMVIQFGFVLLLYFPMLKTSKTIACLSYVFQMINCYNCAVNLLHGLSDMSLIVVELVLAQ